MKRKNTIKMLLFCLLINIFTISANGTTEMVKAEETEELYFQENYYDEKPDSVLSSDEQFYYKFINENEKTVRITGYNGNDVELAVPAEIDGNTVQCIGSWAFYNCRSLVNVSIPQTVTNIENAAFYSCSMLKTIEIPESVKNIGAYTFYGCNSLRTVDLPDGIISIDEYMFYNCISLNNVRIPQGVSSIGSYAFNGCSSLDSILIPENVERIGGYAFNGCSSLSSIIIPENVSVIDSYAFGGCRNLTRITNNSPAAIHLAEVNSAVQWYDITTGSRVEQVANATVSAGELVVVKVPVTQVDDKIVQAVEEITRNAATTPKVFHYDIYAYINLDGEPTLFNNITTELDYPDGVMKGHEIIVLQNGQELANVNKFDNYLTFESSGRGVFTIIALDEGVRNFVGHLYTLVLGREAEQEGLDAWSEALCNKKSSGVDIGYGFVFSDECKERNLSNEEFVEILYKTFLNRPSIDEEGKEAWVSQLDAGVEQEKVFEGFIYSPEFAHICDAYGIQMGRTSDVPQLAGVLRHYRNQNANVTKFVARCYTQALGREFEPEGLEAWCKVILERSNTPKQVAQNFIFSDEFMDKELNSEEYVKVLYRTFMGREADEAGLAAWVNVLESGREDRAKVLEGFSDSEFAEILQQFGLR